MFFRLDPLSTKLVGLVMVLMHKTVNNMGDAFLELGESVKVNQVVIVLHRFGMFCTGARAGFVADPSLVAHRRVVFIAIFFNVDISHLNILFLNCFGHG